MTTPAKKSLSRVWLFDGGAGPTVTPELLAWAAAQGVEKNYGDVERIEVPSQTKRGEFDVVGEIQSGEENATLDISIRYAIAPSRILKVANKRCIADFQIHIGNCTDPRDFSNGWKTGKILAFEGARLTSYSTEELGALESGDESPINEDVSISANDFYEIGPLSYAERAKTEVAQEIIVINVCDSPNCEDCDEPSDGCQKVFAVSAPAGSSPGVLPEVIVSTDGMQTVYQESTITTLAIGEDPDDAACVGDYYVVVSQDSLSLHYALISDLTDNTETWAEISSGFVATHGPRAISSFSPFDTWIGGAGGYIYFTEDPTSGVDVQDSGVATVQDINDIYAFSSDVVVAVGNSNAVAYTINGGETWAAVTGPAVGVNLNAVAVRDTSEWWVGTATGKLYVTKDSGQTWTEKTFSGSGAGAVADIDWASGMVGYMLHATATPAGRIFRTIDGGRSWQIQPDTSSSMPAADRYNSLALCKREVNTVYAAGLAENASDGIIVKGTTSYS